MDYPEGNGYGSIAHLADYVSYPLSASIPSSNLTPNLEEWGAHYLNFLPSENGDNVLTLAFNGRDDIPWGLVIVLINAAGGYQMQEMPLQAGGSGCLSINHFGSDILEVFMIPTILGNSSSATVPSYAFAAHIGTECQQILLQDAEVGSNSGAPQASSKSCFIATAAYGSFESPYVEILRDFRDRYLIPSPWGRSLVDAYYRISPPIAEFIEEHPSAAFITRFLLFPVIVAASLLLALPAV
jgi:hypothetical protein